MEKKNNHYIPKCLLKRWKTNNGKFDGVHVLDLQSKSIDFSASNGKKGFSFASIDNLYVLTKDNDRLVNLENWFDGLENSLSTFIDKVERKDKELFKNLGHLNKLIMSLVAFEFRSRYNFEIGLEYLNKNKEIKDKFIGKDSFQIILENVVNGTTYLSNQIFPVELTVWESDKPLLLSDRPLLFKIVDDYSFFPLTPNKLLSFKKTTNESTINFQKATVDFVDKFNDMITESARDWIVSVQKQDLELISQTKEFKQPVDSVIFNEIDRLLIGYEY